MDSDEVLMLQFQAGSRGSFDELLARYRDPLFAFFRRRVREPDRAQDLAQELWLAVLKGAERYRPRALFRTYLYAIALKLLSRERRHESKRSAGQTIPEDVAIVPDPNGWIREMLDGLDPMDHEILMLREYEDLSYAEIAELLQLPLNTVRSRLFRARLALKRLIDPNSSAIVAAEKR